MYKERLCKHTSRTVEEKITISSHAPMLRNLKAVNRRLRINPLQMHSSDNTAWVTSRGSSCAHETLTCYFDSRAGVKPAPRWQMSIITPYAQRTTLCS